MKKIIAIVLGCMAINVQCAEKNYKIKVDFRQVQQKHRKNLKHAHQSDGQRSASSAIGYDNFITVYDGKPIKNQFDLSIFGDFDLDYAATPADLKKLQNTGTLLLQIKPAVPYGYEIISEVPQSKEKPKKAETPRSSISQEQKKSADETSTLKEHIKFLEQQLAACKSKLQEYEPGT